MGLLLRSVAVVASPLLIYTANAGPSPSPNHSPSVSIVVFIFIRCDRRLPHLSPMLSLIVVFVIVVDHRPSSIVHCPSSIVFRQSSVVSHQHPSSIVRRHVASLSATFPPQHRYHRRLKRLIIVYIS
jgi:hypothetical protein